MRGQSALQDKSVRRVFKAVGSLLCRSIELEHKNRSRRPNQKVWDLGLAKLKSFRSQGADLQKTWLRWRSYDDKSSNFASGNFDVAIELIALFSKESVPYIAKDVSNSLIDFFETLRQISERTNRINEIDGDPYELFASAYSLVFDLAGIDEFQSTTKSSKPRFVRKGDHNEITKENIETMNISTLEKQILDAGLEAMESLHELDTSFQMVLDIVEGNYKPAKDGSSASEIAVQFFQRELHLDAIASLHSAGARLRCLYPTDKLAKDQLEKMLPLLFQIMKSEVNHLKLAPPKL